MFETARDKGNLLPSDLARLLGVNRVTVSNWFNGRSLPHTMILPKVKKLLDGVALAVEAGDLPPPDGLKAKERGPYVSRTLVKHLRAMRSRS